MIKSICSKPNYHFFILILFLYAILNTIAILMSERIARMQTQSKTHRILYEALQVSNDKLTHGTHSTLNLTFSKASVPNSNSKKMDKLRIPLKTVVREVKKADQPKPKIDPSQDKPPKHAMLQTKKFVRTEDFINFLNLEKPGNSLVNTQNFNFLINSNACQEHSPFLVAFVHSAVLHRTKRDIIRQTWGGVQRFHSVTMVTVFLVGQSTIDEEQEELEMEAGKHGDLVQGAFLDSYRNLTLKHVMGLVWVGRHCPQAAYVLKADDDTLVNPFRLLTFLREVGVRDKTIYCRLFSGLPHRSRSKWQVSIQDFPLSKYPTYCEGFAYVLKRNTCKLLTDAARTSRFFWIDDVYVTGLLRIKASVSIQGFKSPFGFGGLTKHVVHMVNNFLFYRGADTAFELYLMMWEAILQNHRQLSQSTKRA